MQAMTPTSTPPTPRRTPSSPTNTTKTPHQKPQKAPLSHFYAKDDRFPICTKKAPQKPLQGFKKNLGHKKGLRATSPKITGKHGTLSQPHDYDSLIFCPSLPKVYICAFASEQPRTSFTPTKDANFVGALLHARTVTVPVAASIEILPVIPNAASA